MKKLLRWPPPPASDKFRLLAGILLLLFGAHALAFMAVTASRMTGPPSGDFFALWSVARFVFERPAVEVYDAAALKAFQLSLGMDPGTNYPFPYPPNVLLALAPFGLSPYLPAYVLIIGGTLAVYIWATVGPGWRWPVLFGALLAPTTTITIVAGQVGLLAAGLLAGGFRLAATRPIAAGILFGLATYKPQMGVLVPIALAAAGLWRVVAAACATVVVLVGLSSAAFGPAIWSAWVANIVQYAGQFEAESSEILYLMPTVSAALSRLGATPAIAHAVQFAAAIAAAGLVWRYFRNGPSPVAASALFVATFLATPHAFVYDMPIVATAVLWFIAERYRAGDTFGSGEIAVMIVAMIAPITLVAGPSAIPLALVSLILLLAIIVRRLEQVRAKPATDSGTTVTV